MNPAPSSSAANSTPTRESLAAISCSGSSELPDDAGYRDYLERCHAGETCEDDCELYGHDADLNSDREYEL